MSRDLLGAMIRAGHLGRVGSEYHAKNSVLFQEACWYLYKYRKAAGIKKGLNCESLIKDMEEKSDMSVGTTETRSIILKALQDRKGGARPEREELGTLGSSTTSALFTIAAWWLYRYRKQSEKGELNSEKLLDATEEHTGVSLPKSTRSVNKDTLLEMKEVQKKRDERK